MAGELFDNPETKAFTPTAIDSSRLVPCNNEMAAFQANQRSVSVAADREQAMFGNGFSFRQASDIYGQKPSRLAQDIPQVPMMPTLVPSPEQLGITKPVVDAARELSALMLERQWNPLRGGIDVAMAQIPEQSWKQAYEAFPQLKQAGCSEQQTKELMQAIIRNELYNYDRADQDIDESFRRGETPSIARFRSTNTLTLGFTQLSTKGVYERQAEFPTQVNFRGHERDALLRPENAPLLVAATLAHNIEMYRRHHVPINEQTLAYGYNPPGKRMLPDETDLRSSVHLKNVLHHLAIIRGQIQPSAAER